MRHPVGADGRCAGVEDLDGVAEGDADRHQLGARLVVGAAAGDLDEEVEQLGLLARLHDEHVAAGAEPGQQRLGRERGQHRGERGVDGVAAGAQHVGAGLGAERMSRRDDAARALLPGRADGHGREDDMTTGARASGTA